MAMNAKCDMCGELKKDVVLRPSRSQLLFGGCSVRFERRCLACEKKVKKWVARLLEIK